jgi:antitoxin (DNA-binding transcriptional repressor) of toxin-antitoxin stability system
MTYTLEQAQTNLAQLLADAQQGQEVVIEREGQPPVRLAVSEASESQAPLSPRVAGRYAGQFVYSDDWWKPLETDEEFREYGFDIMIDDGKPDELTS